MFASAHRTRKETDVNGPTKLRALLTVSTKCRNDVLKKCEHFQSQQTHLEFRAGLTFTKMVGFLSKKQQKKPTQTNPNQPKKAVGKAKDPPVVRHEPGHRGGARQLGIGQLEGMGQLQDDVVAHIIPQRSLPSCHG